MVAPEGAELNQPKTMGLYERSVLLVSESAGTSSGKGMSITMPERNMPVTGSRRYVDDGDTMAVEDDDNEVDGDSAMGDNDGDGATGDNNDGDDDGEDDDNDDGNGAMDNGATGYDHDDDDNGQRR